MECNELDKKNIDKAHFYKYNEKVAHVLTVPKGTFRNGLFVSELTTDMKSGAKFFWFIENGTAIPFRLFLWEIYDIEEYTTKKEGEERK